MKGPIKQAWIMVIVFIFLFVYQFSRELVYIDGDDASSVAYHLLGRDITMQIPYSPYHGMMDKVLSLLPQDEAIVRTVAFEATRFANILMVVFLLAVAFDWLQASGREYSPRSRILFSITFVLAVPELFYFGLVYAPTMVAMCFILFAHILLRWENRGQSMSQNRRVILIGTSILLFGVGVAFRWNTLAYGLVIVADILFTRQKLAAFRNRLTSAIIWGGLALINSFIMISISGYGLSDIRGKFETVLSVINQAGTGSVSDLTLQEMLMRLFLTLSPLLTPIFGLGLLIGVILWIKNRDHLGYIFLAGFLGILPWIRSGVPKFIITILPVLVPTFLFGMNAVLTYINNKRYKHVAFGVLILVLLFPWFIGIQVNRYGTAWGPRFEIKPYSYPEVDGMKFRVTLGPGMAFPTPEGPRALYGHGYVLFHDWKDFAIKRSNERQLVIDTAMRLNIPLLTTAWSPDYYLDSLYALGYQTSDPQDHTAPDDFFIERSFTNSQGNTTSVIYSIDEGSDFPELILHLQNYPDTSKIVIIGYPQTLRSFYKNYPEALEYIGPTSAILDLSQLQ